MNTYLFRILKNTYKAVIYKQKLTVKHLCKNPVSKKRQFDLKW